MLDKLTLNKLRVGASGVIEIADVGRDDLASFMTKDAVVGAEVGVAFGGYSEILMKSNPELKLYGIDPYTTYKGYKDYALDSTMRKLKEDAHSVLDKYPTYQFIEKFSMDAVKDFKDESLDFVYIDANHEDPWVTDDITEWAKKVKKGGVVAGHDYGRVRSIEFRYEVLQAVNRYAQENDIQLIIWGLNSKADRSLKRDSIRSWSFIK
jgi:hypothetical protein